MLIMKAMLMENNQRNFRSGSSEDASRQPISVQQNLRYVFYFFALFLIFYFGITFFVDNQTHVTHPGVILPEQPTRTGEKMTTPIRSFPDTTDGIHVFNDQLATWEMSESQFEFAATHYDGTQKVFASDARRLRASNPKFIVLNYRLGMGLGYRQVTSGCKPEGDWIEIIEGEKWVQEYPENPSDEWFYSLSGKRVFFCQWNWYLMDISQPSWQTYWAGEVLRQLYSTGADGVFVDGMFPPNYYGHNLFSPELPKLDQNFEDQWSSKIEHFIEFTQSGDLEKFHLINNVGLWITGRDKTDYSASDGVMVEGFGRWVEGDYFSSDEGDWQLQMDRILRLVNRDKVVILQQYVDPKNESDRVFLLSNYLLIKGKHTFINMEVSSSPEWFPEYEIPIGSPSDAAAETISSLWRSDWQVYARTYSNGLVLVNPDEKEKRINLLQKFYSAIPFGGGPIPEDGNIEDWAVDYSEVTSLVLGPHQGAILLSSIP